MECVTTVKYSINLNGSLEGFFAAGKGLRQGDPLSPYLFLLVMEAFTCILDANIEYGGFTYHPKCKQLAISHISFADDLFILAKADRDSIQVVHNALKQFERLSGLQANNQKSLLYCAGIPDDQKNALSNLLGMPVGNLPVKYLGVPLITTRLKKMDCQVLVERITGKVKHWSTKLLSYAGRLQLVVSVLSSMATYWCSLFVLPVKIVKEIDRVMSNFLWNGNEDKRHVKIAWKDVCMPKKEGGLGIKLLKEWNKALMAKHLWNIWRKRILYG